MRKPSWSDMVRSYLLPALLLVLATGAVYSGTLGHQFLLNWDDELYVTGNEAIRGFSLDHLHQAFTRYYVGNYAPLQIVSYMLDYSLWGLDPRGFHLTNLLLHTLNGLLFYLLVFRLQGDRWWAMAAAGVFLCHPVQVESVAWVSQRKNLLAMGFFLLAFLAYVNYRGTGRAGWYWGSMGAFLLALLAKSVAVVFPLALVGYDLCFRGPTERRHWLRDKLPFVGVALLAALLAVRSQASDFGGGLTAYHGGSPLITMLTMLPVLLSYLSLLFWPSRLAAVYVPVMRTGLDGPVILALLVLCLLAGAGWFWARRGGRRDLAFWLGIFFVGLLPVSQIVPLVTLMNDRYLYFPMLGFAALVTAWPRPLLARLGPAWRLPVVAVTLLLVTVLALATQRRLPVWRDSLSLWSDAVTKAPDSNVAWMGMADVYLRQGKLDLARAAYLMSRDLLPDNPDADFGLACVAAQAGQHAEALALLAEAFRKGFRGFEPLATEPALAGLRQEPAFISLVDRYRSGPGTKPR
ncbi:MAG TPA: tetratricopeptide repeat protein [Geobacteraceae bacterium]